MAVVIELRAQSLGSIRATVIRDYMNSKELSRSYGITESSYERIRRLFANNADARGTDFNGKKIIAYAIFERSQ